MASKRRIRAKVCEGKKSYPTRDEARNAAGKVSRINRTGATSRTGNVQHYRCRFGHHWHVGHRAGSSRFGGY